jgi:hypothetical protein
MNQMTRNDVEIDIHNFNQSKMKFDSRYIYLLFLIVFSLTGGFYYMYFQERAQIDKDKIQQMGHTIEVLTDTLHKIESNFNDTYISKSEMELEVSKHEKLNQDLSSKLSNVKKMHHLKFVIVTKDDIHDQTRILVASIHSKHKDIKIIIYGIRLHPNLIGELKLWAHVEYIDIEDFLASKRLIEPNEKDLYDLKFWRPVVLQHAAQRYGKVLLVDNAYILTNTIYDIDEILEKHGSWFVQGPIENKYIQCGESFQGYKFNSWAYNNILIPRIRCGYKVCTSDKEGYYKSTNPPSDQRESTQCRPFPSSHFKLQMPENRALICNLVFREDFLYSYSQLPHFPGQFQKKTDGRIHIALGFPSTSKNVKEISIQNNPPVKILIPTLLETIKKSDKAHFYNLYLGFDYMDPFYDNEERQKQLTSHIESMIVGYPISFQFVKCRQTFGWTTFLWNVIFQHAINDGNEYFYQLNDVLALLSPGWTEEFIGLLKNNPTRSNLGVVGPIDEGNHNTLTQTFVHKTHYDIFGYFYPPIFRNWYSDDWISHVYDNSKSTYKSQLKVKNSQVAGTRYIECQAGHIHLGQELQLGNMMIQNYLREK